MSSRNDQGKAKISSDGLRYKTKELGSAFGMLTLGNSAAMMSCFKCGRHKLLTELKTRRILGRNQKICATHCQL
jgi:hypothetical protein